MMRGKFFEHWNIIAASLFSVVLIGGAYYLAKGIENPPSAQASTETALLKAIASKDSDSDGLPDWEEALYGTDSHISDTFQLGMSDGDAVVRGLIVPKAIADVPTATSTAGSVVVDPSLPPAPADGTLTAAFAQNFFLLFMQAKQNSGGADLSEEQMNSIANQAVGQLTASIAPMPDFKTAKDIVVSGSGPEAMKAFAVNAEAIMIKNTNEATTTELNYLQYAVIGGDESAYAKIASIARGYRGTAAGLAALPVPQELAADDLKLINLIMRMGQVVQDFTKADSDPLAAILALQQYPTIVTAFGTTFKTIDELYATKGIVIPDGQPGAYFVNMVSTVAKKVTTASSTSSKQP